MSLPKRHRPEPPQSSTERDGAERSGAGRVNVLGDEGGAGRCAATEQPRRRSAGTRSC